MGERLWILLLLASLQLSWTTTAHRDAPVLGGARVAAGSAGALPCRNSPGGQLCFQAPHSAPLQLRTHTKAPSTCAARVGRRPARTLLAQEGGGEGGGDGEDTARSPARRQTILKGVAAVAAAQSLVLEGRAVASKTPAKKRVDTSPRLHYSPTGEHCPAAVIMLVGGFLIPPFQYDSYAASLAQLGYAVRLCDLEDSFFDTKTLKEGSDVVLAGIKKALQYEEEAALIRNEAMARSSSTTSEKAAFMKRLVRVERDMASQTNESMANVVEQLNQTLPNVPLILVGHSRGAKLCVMAASRISKRISAMVLIDPVDATPFETASVFPLLKKLQIPTAIIGAGGDGGQCAPLGGNYMAWYDAVQNAPRLLSEATQAGHMQFLDVRKALVVDPCPSGKLDDAYVRELALTVLTAWVTVWAPVVVANFPPSEQEAVLRTKKETNKEKLYPKIAEIVTRDNVREVLESTKFSVDVKWTSSIPTEPAPKIMVNL